MSTQLEKDISRKLHERLRQACKDHVSLCDAAGLNPQDALEIMFSTLGAFMVDGMTKLYKITPEQWGEAMAGAMRLAQKGDHNGKSATSR